MHALYEMVKKDPETWSPIEKLGSVMKLLVEPQVGDFMAEHEGQTQFFCTEVTRVRVSSVENGQICFDSGRGIPDWFQHAQSLLRMTPEGVFFAGVKLDGGDCLVSDNRAIRVEKASAVKAS